MMSNVKAIAIAVIFAGAGGWYLGGGQDLVPSAQTTSYEECVIDEMRNQSDSLTLLVMVRKLCSKRSGREVRIHVTSKDDWGWSRRAGDIRVSFSEKILDEYLPTRGTFRTSMKPCDRSKQEDFIFERSGTADNKGTISFTDSVSVGMSVKCLRFESLYGRYR